MSANDHGLTSLRINDALEAAEFDRLKKSGHFVRRAERIAAAKAWNEPLPRAPVRPTEAPSVTILDRSDFEERVAEPSDETGALSIHPLSDADEAVRNLDDDPKQLWIDGLKSTMLEVMRRDTGDCADPAARAKAIARKEELKQISLEIAADLEAEGVANCIRQDEFVMWMQGVHSGLVDAPVRFANQILLPTAAARLRQPMLAAAGYFLQSRPLARTAVFTTGPRTKLRHLRQRVQELNHGLKDLNYEIRKKFGIEIVLRSNELGTEESDEERAGDIERDEDGEPTFHVHAHVIMHHIEGKPLSRDEWNRFLEFTGWRWGYWWRDCGVLRDAAETVKYITKPREIRKLTRQEKGELCRQLRGLKMLQSMGALRAEIKSRDERRKRLDRAPTKDGRVWREIDDWNRGEPRRKPATAAEIAIEAICSHSGDPFAVRDDERPEKGATFTGRRKEQEIETRCVAILPPSFMPGSIIREPIGVFIGKRIDLEAARRDPRCELVREATAPEWLAGQAAAAAIMVHTCTPTVRTEGRSVGRSATVATGPPTLGPPVSAV